MRQSVHTRQPSLSQASFLPFEERGTKGGHGESPVCGQQGCGRVAGEVSTGHERNWTVLCSEHLTVIISWCCKLINSSVLVDTGKLASSVPLQPPRWRHRARREQKTRSSRIPWSSSSPMKRKKPQRRRRAAREEVQLSDASRSSESVFTVLWHLLSWLTTCLPEHTPTS